MQDTFGRKITYLRLSVTDLCNLRCRYCMGAEGVEKRAHSEMCSLEHLRDIAAAAAACGVRKIRLTGGEPLMRRGIVELCRMLREIPGIEELCLTTNGVLLPALAAPLRAAGVDRLNISLDTLRPDRFRDITRVGSLADVLRGLEAAESAGFQNLKLNCVLLGGVSDDEIADGHLRRLGSGALSAVGRGARALSAAAGGWDAGRLPRLPPARCARYGRPDLPDEPPLLQRLRPHPCHGGRAAQALPALIRRNTARGSFGCGAAPRG